MFGCVATIGAATFLLKCAIRDLGPYQVNPLMAVGMVVTGVPALWIAKGSLAIVAGVALLSLRTG